MMRKALIGTVVVLALLGLATGSLAAGNQPASLKSPSAGVIEVGSAGTCAYHTIAAAIAAANPGDTIRVENITFPEDPLVVDKDLTLEGGYPSGAPCLASTVTGHTHVQGTGTARILQVEGATVAISHFSFANNANGGGVAALQGSDLTLVDTYIGNNSASSGGGLRVVDSTASLTDCGVTGNQAQQRGGGIEVLGTAQAASVTLTNTYVTLNNANTYGGGIYAEGNVQVSTHAGTSVSGNTATQDGGAIYIKGQSQVTASEGQPLAAADSQGSTLTLEDNTIISANTATNGGGLKIVGATANLTGCTVTSNHALQHGGGIEVLGTSPTASVTLTRTLVTSNQAGSLGGGLYLEGSAQAVTQEWAQIVANTADVDGGGIYAQGQAQVTINADASTIQWSVVAGNQANRHGGGIHVSQGRVTLNGMLDATQQECLLVEGNIADADIDGLGDGGGLYASGGATVQSDETLWDGNQGQNGGGVYLSGSSFSGEDLTFYNNSAAGDGGGFWAGAGSSLWLSKGSEINDGGTANPNTADNGAGIYAEGGSTVSLDDSTIQGNHAWERGGGVYLKGASTLTASNGSEISFNQTYGFAGIEGGGIYASGTGTTVTINGSLVKGNTAIKRGGGLYVGDGAAATIQGGSTVQDNSTLDFVDGGAGAFVSGADATLTVRDSAFSKNTTATDGGGILNDGGTVHLVEARLSENYAQGWGGGLYNLGGTVDAKVTTFYKNEAHGSNGGGLFSTGSGSIVDLDRSYFANNQAPAASGGGLATYGTTLAVMRGYFANNSSAHGGSALHVTGASTPNEPSARIVNCFILNNTTVTAAGATPRGGQSPGSSLHVEGTSATALHNTFAQTIQQPYGLFIADGAAVTLTNNIISNFSVGIHRPSFGTGTATASYTLFHNNSNNYDWGMASTDELPHGDPAFVGGGDYHLTEPSEAINAGTDAGVTVDWDGESRPWDGGFDIGADEYPDREQLFLPLIEKGQ